MVMDGCGTGNPRELEEGLIFYRQNKLDQALPFLERAAQENAKNPSAHAWLAETCRRLGKKRVSVEGARKALELDPCNSFAHVILADSYNPMYGEWELANSDSTWAHLMNAIRCDSTDGNAWVSIWSESIRRGELTVMRRSLHGMIETGFLTRAALAYARWMLRGLPDRAVLITNGDMDTYPPVALQEVEHFRTDVAVVNRSLLNTVWYERFVRDHCGVPLPFEDARLDSLRPLPGEHGGIVTISDRILREWINGKGKGALSRPIALSVTVDTSVAAGFKDRLRMSGPFFLVVSSPAESGPDAVMLKRNLAGIVAEDFSGPFASAQDRSPVRSAFTKQLAKNVTATALVYGELLIKAGSHSEAENMLAWADTFEKNTELGPVYTEHIAKLKESARKSAKR
jgi:hypothetical protein